MIYNGNPDSKLYERLDPPAAAADFVFSLPEKKISPSDNNFLPPAGRAWILFILADFNVSYNFKGEREEDSS